MRSVSDLPIIAQMTTEEDGNTLDGTPPERFAPELERRGATIIGVNCAVGPAPMLETIERMAAVTQAARCRRSRTPASRATSRGATSICARRSTWRPTRAASSCTTCGVVGGCCGTTPEHIRQIKAAVRGARAGARARVGAARRRAAGAALPARRRSAPPVPREQKSRLAHALARGHVRAWPSSCCRRAASRPSTVDRARARAEDATASTSSTFPDGQRAGARLSALSLAVLIEQQAGIETLLHYSCRDRNLLGIQSDLLGAHAMGLRNLLLITGDPGRVGDYPDATAVFDVDSIGLTNVVSRLNHGCDVGGQPIGAPTAFHIGVSVNPAALEPRRGAAAVRLQGRGRRRVRRDAAGLRRRAASSAFLKRIEPARLPIVAGVFPFESARNAEFMANEVPGRPRAGGAARADAARRRRTDAAAAEGIAIAREIAPALRGAVQGIQVSTPSGNIDAALAVLDGLR